MKFFDSPKKPLQKRTQKLSFLYFFVQKLSGGGGEGNQTLYNVQGRQFSDTPVYLMSTVNRKYCKVISAKPLYCYWRPYNNANNERIHESTFMYRLLR